MKPPLRIPNVQGIELTPIDENNWRGAAFLGDEPVILKLTYHFTTGWVGSVASPDDEAGGLEGPASIENPDERDAADYLADALASLGLFLSKAPIGQAAPAA